MLTSHFQHKSLLTSHVLRQLAVHSIVDCITINPDKLVTNLYIYIYISNQTTHHNYVKLYCIKQRSPLGLI